MTDNAIAAFGGAGLPSRETVAQFLNSASQAVVGVATGKQFLKISDKDGTWTYGAEETVVEEGSLWAINPLSMFHGYIAWHDAKVEMEHRQSIQRPLPALETFPAVQAQNGLQKQYGFDIVCVSGEDDGVLCEYKASSVGGSRAFANLVNALNAQFMADPDKLVPVVVLKDNKYYDKKYKKDQFPPVFEIVEWRSMGDDSPVDKPAEKEAPPARIRTRRELADTAAAKVDEDKELAEAYNAEAEKVASEAVPRRRVRR